MTAIDKKRRLYTEAEIGRMIQRATDLQHKAHESADRGLSLDEIEHIAAELGVEPAHLQRAAMELEHRPREGARSRFWGGPFLLEQQRIVEGTVTDEQWEEMVQGLRRLTGSRGRVDTLGQTREWSRSVKDLDFLIEQTQVSVRSRGDQTAISVRKQYRGGAGMAYVLAVLAGVTAAGVYIDSAGLSELVNTLILGGSGVGALAAARASIAVWTKRQRERVKSLTDWLQEAVPRPEPPVLIDGAETESYVTETQMALPARERSA